MDERRRRLRMHPSPFGWVALLSVAACVLGAPMARPAAGSPPPAAAPAPSARELRNLEAFARLYGWVRWFHPSDEASRVDWNGMAVVGAERVRSAADDPALRRALEALFLPVAPSVRLHGKGETPKPVPPPPAPADRWQTIAWQHSGMGQGESPYVSARLHRAHAVAGEETAPFGTATQALPAADLRGKRVRLRAAVRTEVHGAANQAQLWLRVDRKSGMGFFDNMGDRPIKSRDWKTYEIVGDVAADAERVVFGCFLNGQGKAWLDDVEVAVEEGGAWRPLPVANPGFEQGEQPTGWRAKAPGYTFTVVHDGAFAGKAALTLAAGGESSSEPLFAEAPALGEAQEGELVAGLWARVPLSVPGDDKSTWPPAGAEAFAALQADLAKVARAGGDDWRVRVAGVVITWNVLEHFYPYFDVVPVDWPAQLPVALRGALTDHDALGLLDTLRRLIASAQDGHGTAYNPGLNKGFRWLPCQLDVVEGRVAVTVADDGGVLRRGDVVRTIDGEDALTILAREEALRSGTPQWRRESARWQLGLGDASRPAQLEVERDGAKLHLELPRAARPPGNGNALEPIAALPGGALYVDLTRAEAEAIQAKLAELAAAPALVFDLRGYPRDGAQKVLQHLTETPLQSAIWQVPRLIYPDHRRQVGWDTGGRWDLPPVAPRFRGKVAFLTGPSAISYAESVMGIVEAYHLGEIVGATTAGTNGNVNPFDLPGGYKVMFTGMRVLKNDGSQHHLVGIHPTVPVSRTLAALRAGRDEELAAALKVLGVR